MTLKDDLPAPPSNAEIVRFEAISLPNRLIFVIGRLAVIDAIADEHWQELKRLIAEQAEQSISDE